MSIVEIDVKYVANLARLELKPDEEARIGTQLGQVLEYMDQLKRLDVSQVEPTAHAAPRVNVMRLDEVGPSLPLSEVLRNAPAQANDLFLVPKIVE
ncbi:MAG TPA: Asp-tRNA(Asn)/Glu-tRNA(Gln) amidotransferase subunit GatC [Candidatus Paceibacterota bacterium]|nr:Asp-tRNA(Asn)/Glu-tRNA(Gln) amidotransferase subunit GatC [Verrucomicrobiota bacterium]HRY50013.1 Asp-tRNA(Asn)/Glu-tRNA(Gln) amidotransferase subunit GatC [Candidatus Paceibacterota bacterium]HSA01828.1 Asp-tRNA(Asn)/Glu-tRNA(Gln) amidotransferase subunit GatC [Candidatus Paceibacterota bacterium]